MMSLKMFTMTPPWCGAAGVQLESTTLLSKERRTRGGGKERREEKERRGTKRRGGVLVRERRIPGVGGVFLVQTPRRKGVLFEC